MTISFTQLDESHFPLLLKWLETPHVKQWWPVDRSLQRVGGDQVVDYTIELVREKYSSYINGYKLANGQQKPIQAFIIYSDQNPVGYIQIYNAYDFLRSNPLKDLPLSLGALDLFIGEGEFINKGLGSEAINLALDKYLLPKYKYVLVNPEYKNIPAVKAYEKSGFKIIKRVDQEFWMVTRKPVIRMSIADEIALEVSFRNNFLPEDRLWLFGSRSDLTKKGGDIDLYTETYATTAEEAIKMRRNFLWDLMLKIGEQKIDLVLNLMNYPHPLPIHEVALKEGVRII